MPGAILNGILSIFTGKFYDKYGLKPLVYTGFILLILATLPLCFLQYDSSYMFLVIIYALRLVAISLLMMPINTTGINVLDNKDISRNSYYEFCTRHGWIPGDWTNGNDDEYWC